MRLLRFTFVVVLAGVVLAAPRARADQPPTENVSLTAATLPQFLAAYQTSLDSVDAAFQNLESANLPLFDEAGHPLERRNIKDRHQTVSDLRDTVKQLGKNPQSLLLTLTLFDRSEKLADDLYDLSQIAYDSDQEELGSRLSELVTAVDHNQDSLESYALDLAAKAEERLNKLESENRDLQAKLKQGTEGVKTKSTAPRP